MAWVVDWPWSHQVNGTDQERERSSRSRGWQGMESTSISGTERATMAAAGATDAAGRRQAEGAWMRDDTRKRSAGGHIGYSENTSCRSVHASDNYYRYSYSGFYQKIRGWEKACTYMFAGERKGMQLCKHIFFLYYILNIGQPTKKVDDGFCF